jgi:hypothetical protein
MNALWERVKALFQSHKTEAIILLVAGYILGRIF